MTGFFLLLPVVPLYATSAGAGQIGAGVTTAALLLSTICAELATPRLVPRFGDRLVFGAGLVLMGAPALALVVSAHLAVIVAVSVVRGLGFGIVVVLGNALVATMVPASRRGEGLGVFGIVIGVPGVLALPSGVFLVGEVGYPPVLVAGGVAALAGLVTVSGMPGPVPAATGPVGMLAALRDPGLLRPSLMFGAAAMAAGVIVTFLPLAVTGASAGLAALGLLLQTGTATVTRWWAGRYGDRHDPARLVVPGVLACAAGVFALVLITSPVAVLAGMVLFGAGFGVSQNASLVVMFNRVPSARYGTVSALWNLAFDAGMGLGAVGFGVLVARTGYPVAFAVLAAVVLVALVGALRDRHATARAMPSPRRSRRSST
jgi:predicted MFS family arabinose efflux permease